MKKEKHNILSDFEHSKYADMDSLDFWEALFSDAIQIQQQQTITGHSISNKSMLQIYENCPVDSSLSIDEVLNKIKIEFNSILNNEKESYAYSRSFSSNRSSNRCSYTK